MQQTYQKHSYNGQQMSPIHVSVISANSVLPFSSMKTDHYN